MDSQSGLSSCLYECQIVHHRFHPKVHKFKYGAFYFCIDLDEIPQVCSSINLIQHQRWGFYSFYEEDFIDQSHCPLKKKVLNFVAARQADFAERIKRVKLLTSLRVFGYIFNPISIYYCLDQDNQLVCAIAEVTNTFREAKLYFLPNSKLVDAALPARSYRDSDDAHLACSTRDFGVQSLAQEQVIKARLRKLFYVSPFSRLDTFFDFVISPPDRKLHLQIDSIEDAQTILASIVTGVSRPLNTIELVRLTLFYPLMSLRVISLIHLHAFKLFLKGLPFIVKEDNPHLQTEVLKPHRSLRGVRPQSAIPPHSSKE